MIVLIGACRVPYRRGLLTPAISPPGEKVFSDDIVRRFLEESPASFKLLTSVVFKFKFQKITGIGCLEIDRNKGTFSVACVNPLGVKLFEMSGDRKNTVCHYALEDFKKRGDIASAIGEDIRRMYFDIVPSNIAGMTRKRGCVVIGEQQGRGTAKYWFSVADGLLVRKDFSENGKMVWRITMNGYRRIEGKNYPGMTVLSNYKYGYSLEVRMKEVVD